jgi:hypothetical protein
MTSALVAQPPGPSGGTGLVGLADVDGTAGAVDAEFDGAVGDSDGPRVDAAVEVAKLVEVPVGGGAWVHPASTATAIVIVIAVCPRRSVVNRPTIS